jgi:hypothetical protein
MYKTGTEIEFTHESFDSLRARDFLPEGTMRKVKICFKSNEQTKVCDAVLENNELYSYPIWNILMPAERDNRVGRLLTTHFYRDTISGILCRTDNDTDWASGTTAALRQWFEHSSDSLRVTFIDNPVKPERLSGIKTIFNTAYSGIKNEVGSELELEATTPELARFGEGPLKEKVKKISKMSIVDNIGRDCSVLGYGPEIRFNHPTLGKWRKDAIERVLSAMKEIGFSAGRSAGQHVHVSHPKIKVAIYKSRNDITGTNKFLQPISCRQANPRYGLGANIIRDQFNCFKTLEIRVWESTTNADLFKKRLRFANALVKCLIRKGVDYKNIWTKMPKTMGEDYVDMLFIDNPHQVGMSTNDVMSRLPDSLKAYAREKYGWCEPQP